MKKVNFLLIFLIFIALIVPFATFSDNNCSNSGTTIFYINGIFGDRIAAGDDMSKLKTAYNHYYPNSNIIFHLAYNESYVQGLADLVTVVTQMYSPSVLN